MTLIEAIDAARGLINEPLDSARSFPDNTSSFWTDTILMTYFNMIQEEVQDEIIQADEDYFVTGAFLSIVNGTSEYPVPSGTIKVVRVEDARGSGKPIPISPTTMNNQDDIGGIDGLSSTYPFGGGGYYLRGNQIVLTDTPDYTDASAIRVYISRKLADVTAASSVSEIPVQFHRVFVWGIVKMALFSQQSDPNSNRGESQFDKIMAKIVKNVEDRQVQTPRRVKQYYNDAN